MTVLDRDTIAQTDNEVVGWDADPVLHVSARGESPVERVVSLLVLGDLVSVYAAILRAADPVDIPAIDGLKAALAAR